jgi:4-amino-4-deoxy-L-arabinose transferase-like glycosyltransferase
MVLTDVWPGVYRRRIFLFLFVLAVAAVACFHRLSEAQLGGDDCYYAEVAKEMARAGDYLTPRNAGQVDFHTSKPPMLYWMAIAAGRVFGFTNFAMRLPAAVLGFLGILALFLFVERYYDPVTAFFAALILTFTQQYLYHVRSAVTDGPFAVFFAFALFAFWQARTTGRPLHYYMMGAALGCAVMTRQIPGFFILCVMGAYFMLARETRMLRNPHLYGALLLAAVIILPWHLIMYRWYGSRFLTQYFGVTLLTGLKGYPAGYSSSPSLNPWYAYGSILLSNYEPWLPFLVAALYQGRRRFRTFEKERRVRGLFVVLWVAVPLAIFQLAAVKQYHYIVPLYVPLAILTATFFGNLREPAKMKAAGWLAAAAGVLSAAWLLFPIVPATLDSREFKDTVLLAPAARAVAGDLATLRAGFCHYNNCLQFYADKKVLPRSEDEIVAAVNAGAAAVLSRQDFVRIARRVDWTKARIVQVSEQSVLFAGGRRAH